MIRITMSRLLRWSRTNLMCLLGLHSMAAPIWMFWPDKTKRELVKECKRCKKRCVVTYEFLR